jgi:hypothetical protein
MILHVFVVTDPELLATLPVISRRRIHKTLRHCLLEEGGIPNLDEVTISTLVHGSFLQSETPQEAKIGFICACDEAIGDKVTEALSTTIEMLKHFAVFRDVPFGLPQKTLAIVAR